MAQTRLCALATLVLIMSPALALAAETQPRAIACAWIKTVSQLQAMQNSLAGAYCLANDIDASAKTDFVPIGTKAAPFTGRFYGNGHVIRNLAITSSAAYVGLFGYVDQAVVQDLGLLDTSITGTAEEANVGGVVGNAVASTGGTSTTIARVSVSGQVACTQRLCNVGGIAALLDSGATLRDSWSAAQVRSTDGDPFDAGGAVAIMLPGSAVIRTFTTGSVTCTRCFSVGGLVGSSEGRVLSSYATGPVVGGDRTGGAVGYFFGSMEQSFATGAVSGDFAVGGLVGLMAAESGQTVSITKSYATGPVSSVSQARVGGLVGFISIDSGEAGSLTETYAVGAVGGPAGAKLGGLVGAKFGTGTFADDFNYWDLDTSGQFASGAGIARSTADMRTTVPCCLPGEGDPWARTLHLSYPFLNDDDIDFASPLSTLVRSNKVFVFLPLDQFDPAQYASPPQHSDEASLAAVYTMIARAIGITDDDAQLKDVKIDTYFWSDASKKAIWTGPITTHAKRGALQSIPAAISLNTSNVVGLMKKQKLVILRGSYTKSDGTSGTHWLLGTLFTTPINADSTVSAIVAHDPFTGKQIEIDPDTKQVLGPDFPLVNFTVNGYRPVLVN